jgi:hypothetical protein
MSEKQRKALVKASEREMAGKKPLKKRGPKKKHYTDPEK